MSGDTRKYVKRYSKGALVKALERWRGSCIFFPSRTPSKIPRSSVFVKYPSS